MKGNTMTRIAHRLCISFLFVTQLCILPAAAEDSFATILSPANGTKLEAKHTYKVEYEKSRPKGGSRPLIRRRRRGRDGS